MIRIKNFLFNEDDIKYIEKLIYHRATTPNEYGIEVNFKKEPTIKIKFDNEIDCNNAFERISNNNVELLQNDLDNANSKVSELSNRILEAIEILNQPMLSYASCVKALDEIEEILKGSDK